MKKDFTLVPGCSIKDMMELIGLADSIGIPVEGALRRSIGQGSTPTIGLSFTENALWNSDESSRPEVDGYVDKYEFITHLRSSRVPNILTLLNEEFSYTGLDIDKQRLLCIAHRLKLPIWAGRLPVRSDNRFGDEYIIWSNNKFQGAGKAYGPSVTFQEFINRMLTMVGVVPLTKDDKRSSTSPVMNFSPGNVFRLKNGITNDSATDGVNGMKFNTPYVITEPGVDAVRVKPGNHLPWKNSIEPWPVSTDKIKIEDLVIRKSGTDYIDTFPIGSIARINYISMGEGHIVLETLNGSNVAGGISIKEVQLVPGYDPTLKQDSMKGTSWIKKHSVVTFDQRALDQLTNLIGTSAKAGYPYLVKERISNNAFLYLLPDVEIPVDLLTKYDGVLEQKAKVGDNVIRINGSNCNMDPGDIGLVESGTSFDLKVRNLKDNTSDSGHDPDNFIPITIPSSFSEPVNKDPIIKIGDVVRAVQDQNPFRKGFLYVVSSITKSTIQLSGHRIVAAWDGYFEGIYDLETVRIAKKRLNGADRIGLRTRGFQRDMKTGDFATYNNSYGDQTIEFGNGHDPCNVIDVTDIVLPEQYTSPIPGLQGGVVARTATGSFHSVPIPNTNGQLQRPSIEVGRPAAGRTVQRSHARRPIDLGSRYQGKLTRDPDTRKRR